MLKTFVLCLFGLAIAVFYMRFPNFGILRSLSTMAKEVKVEPYSMAFVTAPDSEVAKKLAGGLGNSNEVTIQAYLELGDPRNW